MGRREELAALRDSVAISTMEHVSVCGVRGEAAWTALDGVVAAELRIREGQLLHSVLLDESGRLFADVHVGCDQDEFFLLAEGPSGGELEAFLRRHAAAPGVEVEDRSASHALVTLNGPYAWELLALLAGADVVGLPYQTFYRNEWGLCFRAGKTGEYGYGLLVPRARAGELLETLDRLGAPLDAARAGLETLDQCALENGYVNIRREGREPVTPIELQLQWRVSYRKRFVGSEALSQRRREGARRRLGTLVAAAPLAAGQAVKLAGRVAGRIVNAGYSETRGDWAALALIDLPWAHPGIDGFQVEGKGGSIRARSVTSPLLNNRSLHVSPQIHSYATRGEFEFPPLVRS